MDNATTLRRSLHRHVPVPRHPTDAFAKLDMREETYGWNLEMQMKAARAGLRILEIPVNHRRRTGGESKVSGTLRGTFVAGARIIATLLRVTISPKE